MRVAAPPETGSVQMLPCRSIASVRPSGDTPTDIDVPSWTTTSISAGAEGGAAPNAATRTTTPSVSGRPRMKSPLVRVFYLRLARVHHVVRAAVARVAEAG